MLTAAQYSAFKANLAQDATLSALPNNSDGNSAIAAAYNADASPDFWVWRTRVSKDELVNTTSLDTDGITPRAFTWSGYVARSQGERDAFNAIFDATGYVNAALPQVRQAFLDIFSGSTNSAPSIRQHLANVARRKASRIEKLFATGTGTSASPAVLTFEGRISAVHVEIARSVA